ncbi:GTP cyclohydrolase 1 [Venturia nashicola]|uniref:GTP cyclohydrolase 1 n=1 Tax=Venturia nashicola TaxID=86259 RepID=A0A4Z1PM32_9PEZI|nr:GTP cyclohydrolase 1 [Venturia nashicola]
MPSVGIFLLCFPAVFLCAGAFLADFNETHVYNPNWPPHARFHNGQTMSMAVVLGAATLWYAIRSAYLPTPTQKRESLFTAAMIGSMYAVTGLSAILYPGSAGCDPDLCGPEGTFVQKHSSNVIELGRYDAEQNATVNPVIPAALRGSKSPEFHFETMRTMAGCVAPIWDAMSQPYEDERESIVR